MNKKLYVGNLDYSVDQDQLKTHFAQAGTVVDAVVIKDKYSGRSKGFGFVEMSTEEEAKKAIEMFGGKDTATERQLHALSLDLGCPRVLDGVLCFCVCELCDVLLIPTRMLESARGLFASFVRQRQTLDRPALTRQLLEDRNRLEVGVCCCSASLIACLILTL